MDVAPDLFTADYTGQPGDRTFFLQSRDETRTLTYLVEKQQVAALGEKLRELLLLVDAGDTVTAAVPARDPALRLVAPIEPEWRVGTMGLTYEEVTDEIAIAMGPVVAEEDEVEAQEVDEFPVRFLLRREQVRAFVLHALAIVDEGRPLCQLCGLPMDPSGHNCPASNGHRIGV